MLRHKDIEGKHSKTLDQNTRRGYLLMARALFAYAEDCDYVSKNPVLKGFVPPAEEERNKECTYAASWEGKVVGISDGDTIKVLKDGKQVKIRLAAIDCPEKG